MTTATNAAPGDRLRQIAILISSVDAAAARQILLHLPTELARQVRETAGRLGHVPTDERRRILAEFQRSAASSSAAQKSSGSEGLGVLPSGAAAGATDAEPAANSAAWTSLNTVALLRFVRDERPAVTAVVISQLAPSVAVDVLQRLPLEVSREVMLRLSRLQEIDPEAMQAIDEYLSQRLQEYQNTIQGELDNTRRIESLLAAAPPTLRNAWRDFLGSPTMAAHDTSAAQAPHGYAMENYQSHGVEEADLEFVSQPDARPESTPSAPSPDSADILPFPGVAAPRKALSRIERERMQLEFERILQLPPTVLAELLSGTDSQTVLLALAGASPEFMKRFYRMLNRPDAKALEARLQRIGSIQLIDVDEAQLKIVENARRIGTARQGREFAAGQGRRAA